MAGAAQAIELLREQSRATLAQQELERRIVCGEIAAGTKLNEVDVAGTPVSYTHLRAHETALELVCRLLLLKKKKHTPTHTQVQDNRRDIR